MKTVGITLVMIITLCLETGLNTLIKFTTSRGMSNFVFIAYSNALALFVLVPATLLFHRKRAPPSLSTTIVCKMLLVSSLSCAAQIMMYSGIKYSSPTLSSAMMDLTPAFTFILAIASRTEKLDMKLRSSQAKSMGTVASIIGALIVTLYKGLPLGFQSTNETFWTLFSRQSDWIFGGLLLALSSLCISVLYVVQTLIIMEYPAELVVTSICCGCVTIFSFIVGLIAEPNPKAWILRPDINLVSIIYSAIFVVAARSVVHIWACHLKGALYVVMFNPLGVVVACIMGVIFLHDTLYLGSLIGAGILAIGFYAVLWGRSHEEDEATSIKASEICDSLQSSTAPLLQNNITGV